MLPTYAIIITIIALYLAWRNSRLTPVEDMRVRNPIDGGLDEIAGVTSGVIETRTTRDKYSST